MVTDLDMIGLGGLKWQIQFPVDGGKGRLAACVMHLMGEEHHGHHFAIVGEGYTLACSDTAIECLEDAGLLDNPPPEQAERDIGWHWDPELGAEG
jgi:hypothetical protein